MLNHYNETDKRTSSPGLIRYSVKLAFSCDNKNKEVLLSLNPLLKKVRLVNSSELQRKLSNMSEQGCPNITYHLIAINLLHTCHTRYRFSRYANELSLKIIVY